MPRQGVIPAKLYLYIDLLTSTELSPLLTVSSFSFTERAPE